MSTNPSDLLQQNQFTLAFNKLPNTILRVQKCPIPVATMTHSEIGTPFSFIREPDTRILYGPLSVQFKLDVNFDAYLDIYNWLFGLGFPETFDEYRNLLQNDRKNLFSDAILSVYTNYNIPNVRIKFKDAFPTGLSEVVFDTTVTDATFIDVTAEFQYQYYTIEKLS